MIDSEKHRFAHVELEHVAASIRAAGPEQTILSSDSGSFVLAPPVEAFREWLVMIESAGFDAAAIRRMAADNPARVFKLASA